MKYFLLTLTFLSATSFASAEHHSMNHHQESTDETTEPMTDHQMMDSMEMPAEAPSESMNHGHKMEPHHSDNPSTEGFMHINHTMHEAMDIEFTGNPDIDFLRGMIPHHQGAVDMAQVQLEHGRDGGIKFLSQGIIRSQDIEIAIMKRKLHQLEQAWDGVSQVKPLTIRGAKMINHKMHEGMMIEFSGQADIDFVRGMKPHHQGAVDMANLVLAYGQDTSIKRLAREIIDAQVEEINFMNVWLRRVKQLQ